MPRVEDARHEICIYCHEDFNVSKDQYIPRSGYVCYRSLCKRKRAYRVRIGQAQRKTI